MQYPTKERSLRIMVKNGRFIKSIKVFAIASSLLSAGGVAAFTTPANAATPVTISVVLAAPPLPKAMMDEFTKATGITVKWTQVDWDSLQTKIAAAAVANTYFADATDVDWSRVGQLGKLNWFQPMEKYLDTKTLKADMPQLPDFTKNGHVIGIPWDASFMVTTVNKALLKKAGITQMPTTINAYTKDLQIVKAKGVVKYPLNIPFAAAEGLSTYWYETSHAFGGQILDASGKPLFTSPSSGGYKAATWMISAMKTGLVPPGNINVADSQGQQTLMATGKVVSTFSDYSGNVGTLYDVPASSSVVNQVNYLHTPGVSGVTTNWGNADGIGSPIQAKKPVAAATFIKWFTSAKNMADFAGASGVSRTWSGYFVPSRLSGIAILNKKGSLIGGDVLTAMLKAAKPVFPLGAPAWYPQFSSAVNTNLHAAATGSMTVDAAIKAIAAVANKLSSGK